MFKKSSRIYCCIIPLILCIANQTQADPPQSQPSGQKPRRPLAAGMQTPPGVKAMRDLEYARPNDKPLLLDLYVPESPKGKLPLVVWIHGGGWRAGDKTSCPALPMTAHGYAAASIDYRLTTVAPFPAQIEDCKAAIRWFRANAKEYNIDPDRIGVWGASAGGHLVALLGTSGDIKTLEGKEGNEKYSSRVQAVCDWFGPSDLIKLEAAKINPLKSGTSESLIGYFLGGPVSENLEKAEQANPITHITKDDPPFLIMHGTKDPLVPLDQSEILNAALKKAGVESTLYVVKDGGHGSGFDAPEVKTTIGQFFKKHLKGSMAKTANGDKKEKTG